ncbi:CPBP family intramembrane glutamic endopeptidase [Nonomuraea sp. NPDC050547]|uniref:CPBP family intramembrane glutamic endopeptidase n=1 Tax=unclassified Nonomuraea TaxID=2593643 RepID=UPI0037AA0189
MKAFFILVTALSIPLWVAGALVDVTEDAPFGVSLGSLMVFVPGVAAAILVLRGKGRLRLGPAPGWGRALAAVAVGPVLGMAAYLIGPAAWTGLAQPLAALPLLFAVFVVLAVFEELGWTAYATEPLRERWGPTGAGLVLGAFWAAWHLPALLMMGRGALWIAGWTLGTVAQRVIMVWLFDRTGRGMWAVVLMHAGVNLSVTMTPGSASTAHQVIFGLLLAVPAALVLRYNLRSR